MEGCVAQNISSAAPTDAAYGFAIGSFEDSNQLLRNCVAQNITNASTSPFAAAAGFLVGGPSANIVLQDCIAQDMISLTPTYPNQTVGFYVFGPSSEGEMSGCLANNCGVGYYLYPGYPYLGGAQYVFKNNEAINNAVAGFWDESGSTGALANVFKQNEAAYNNGQNYVGMPAGTPIRTWTLSDGYQPNTVTDVALFTGSISGSPVFSRADIIFTGSISENILYVLDVTSGLLAVGETITAYDVTPGTIIEGFDSASGGVGSYYVSSTPDVELQTMQASPTLNVSAVSSGALTPGLVLEGDGIVAGTSITGFGTGNGYTGSYLVNFSQTVPAEGIVAGNPASDKDNLNII